MALPQEPGRGTWTRSVPPRPSEKSDSPRLTVMKRPRWSDLVHSLACLLRLMRGLRRQNWHRVFLVLQYLVEIYSCNPLTVVADFMLATDIRKRAVLPQ